MSFSVPFQFTPGSVAQSGQVNANFASNVSAENNLQAQITAILAAGTQLVAPQGRLTLTSGVPVLSANVVNAGTVYYTPYVGAILPIYNGTSTSTYSFSEKSLILDTSSHLSTHIYDIFGYLASSVVAIGTGPAWSTNTARSAALTRSSNGFLVNNALITLTNNSAGVSVMANQATYLGSIYCNGNAQVSMNFQPAIASGGVVIYLGLFNAYNQTEVSGDERDSGAGATGNFVNFSANDNITVIDGLGTSPVEVVVTASGISTNSTPTTANAGTSLVSSTTPVFYTGILANGQNDFFITVPDNFAPALGLRTFYGIVNFGSVQPGLTWTTWPVNFRMILKVRM